jgi:uncharacterized membrane protein
MTFPPIQPWDALHPLVIHFPIALLMVAPIFILLGMFLKRSAREFALSALILMLLGTVGTYVAVETGEAGAKLVERTPEISAVLEQHEERAEQTRLLFTLMTVACAALLFIPLLLKRELGYLWRLAIHGVFLLAYVVCLLSLARTAHLGGRLVHELGVRALLVP